nr:MAG: ORF1 [Torque teno polar bear virus 10]
MPFYGRRRRRFRRRFPRRRRFFRYRRWYPWWRRRFYRRSRSRPVRQTRPKFIKLLKIKGVELLGEQGSRVSFKWNATDAQQGGNQRDDNELGTWSIDIENLAPSNKEVTYLQKWIKTPSGLNNDCGDSFPADCATYWDFVGGFGQAHFTLFGLIMRAILAFARFSVTLERVQFIKFLGVKFWLQRAPDVNYLFLAEEHRNGQDYEKDLITPLNLLNTPGTVVVRSFKQTHCCRNPSVKKRADPTVFGWHDIEDFMHVPLISYVWTVFNPNNPLGRNDQITKFLKSPLQNNWMRDMCNQEFFDYCPKYNMRTVWDRTFVQQMDNVQLSDNDPPKGAGDQEGQSSWWEWIKEQTIGKTRVDCNYGAYAPFLPPMIAADTPQTLWFRYQFLFQLGGKSVGFSRQRWPVKEADTCPSCPSRPRDPPLE